MLFIYYFFFLRSQTLFLIQHCILLFYSINSKQHFCSLIIQVFQSYTMFLPFLCRNPIAIRTFKASYTLLLMLFYYFYCYQSQFWYYRPYYLIYLISLRATSLYVASPSSFTILNALPDNLRRPFSFGFPFLSSRDDPFLLPLEQFNLLFVVFQISNLSIGMTVPISKFDQLKSYSYYYIFFQLLSLFSSISRQISLLSILYMRLQCLNLENFTTSVYFEHLKSCYQDSRKSWEGDLQSLSSEYILLSFILKAVLPFDNAELFWFSCSQKLCLFLLIFCILLIDFINNKKIAQIVTKAFINYKVQKDS